MVLIKNAVETLGYFSAQLAAEFELLGYEIYWIDYDDLYVSMEGVERFLGRGKTALVTFNFIGLSGEEIFLDEKAGSLWERYDVRVFCVLADHPMYYHRQLVSPVRNLTVFCVDRGHVRYVQRFYPGTEAAFLPLAGNVCGSKVELLRLQGGNRQAVLAPLPYGERRYGVLFTANYVPPDMFAGKLTELGAEYEGFYREILSDLLEAPEQPLDAVMERHVRTELGAVSEATMAEALYGMRWLDLLARTLLRGELVRRIAEADIPVHVLGAGWERLECKKPENLVRVGGQVDSATCAAAVQQARIALNVLPWFRDGAHDRIFTAMLQGTLALTDGSAYLREEFADGKELVYFSLRKKEELPELVRSLLDEPERAGWIAGQGCKKAWERHTWGERAMQVAAWLDTVKTE